MLATRSIVSTLVYQPDYHIDPETLRDLCPDLVFILPTDPETSWSRVKSRGLEISVFEDPDLLRGFYTRYMTVAERNPCIAERIHYVPTHCQTPDQCREYIESIIGERRSE